MKGFILKCWPGVVIAVILTVVYRGWFSKGVITYADWGYYSSARLQDFWPIPSLWDGANGTGGAVLLSGPMFPLLFMDGLLNHLGLGFAYSERLVWIFPEVLAASFATYALSSALYQSRVAGVISALAVTCNSYILMIMTGGQFTVAAGGLLLPVILWLFYRSLVCLTAGRLALTALVVGVQVMYDLRSTYLTVGVLALFAIYYVLSRPRDAAARSVGRVVLQFVAIGVVTVLMHLSWLLPARFSESGAGGGIALPAGYNSTFWVHVLSYMGLTHAFALFHPFWYQKTLRPSVASVDPIFFLLPLLAFGVFLRKRVTSTDLFLFSLALLSIFFVKGSNAPAGGIYDWMFTHVPGFSLYRDPSKFYQPLMLAYALLIGKFVAVFTQLRWASTRPAPWTGMLNTLGRAGVLCASLISVLIPVVPVVTSAPYGALDPISTPSEYSNFQHFLDSQPGFFRTMWVFDTDKFMGNSALHPDIGADSLTQLMQQAYGKLPDPSDAASWLLMPQAYAALQALSVKYVVVGDFSGINLGSTSYRKAQDKAVKMVRRALTHATEITIGHLHVFRINAYLPAVFVAGRNVTHSTAQVLLKRSTKVLVQAVQRVGRPDEYASSCTACFITASQGRTRFEIVVRNARRPFLLILNQGFDPNWAAYVEPANSQPFWWTWTHQSIPRRYHTIVNGYANAWWVDTPGTHHIVIEYWPQRLTDIGFVLCWLTIAACVTIAAILPALKWAKGYAVGRIAVRQGTALIDSVKAPRKGMLERPKVH